MFIEERHREILKLLELKNRIKVAEIQKQFNISADSARRDLRILEEKGLLKRTHGGAIPRRQVRVSPPPTMAVNDFKQVLPHYDAIASKAAEYINQGDAVYICAASVGFLMTRHLPRDIKFTVVTNSLTVAAELRTWDNIETYLTGGKLRPRGFITDPKAIETIKNMRLDIAFISGAGFSAEFGLSNGRPETASFQKAVIESSKRSICLMPHEKIGFESFVKTVEAARFELLITDEEALEEQLTAIAEQGVEIVLV